MPSDLHLIDLSSSWALLRVSGADADTFLQGQLGNDLRKLSPGQSQISSYSSPKGRMLATMTLSRDVDASAVDIELPRPLAEAIARRLRMFVLRSKVQIADAPLSLLGLRGPGASAALTNTFSVNFFSLAPPPGGAPARSASCLRAGRSCGRRSSLRRSIPRSRSSSRSTGQSCHPTSSTTSRTGRPAAAS